MATVRATKGTRKSAATALAEPPIAATFAYDALRAEIEAELRRNLNEWLPRVRDDKGGFYQAFDQTWKRPKKDEPRFSVFQSRVTWLASKAIAIEPKRRKEFETLAEHGLSFMASQQWDSEHGGFFDNVSRDGKPVTDGHGQIKSIYSNAFGVYALAAMYRATGNLFALDLGFEAFEWIDAFAHDDLNEGYFNVLAIDAKSADGLTLEEPDETKTPGIKTMNTHIHLLEAFTELLRAAPHVVVRERVEELVRIVRDKIASPDGSLVERLTLDWKPISATKSFGHDVETAFLLLDSSEAIGDAQNERTRQVARSLVDHALQFGWNESLGYLVYSADAKGKVLDTEAKWWASAEALNAFLLMHELFGTETDKYWKAFEAQWAFIKKHHIDAENGGWFDSIAESGKPVGTHKGGPWKEAYHETRAMAHVVERLSRLSNAETPAAE